MTERGEQRIHTEIPERGAKETVVAKLTGDHLATPATEKKPALSEDDAALLAAQNRVELHLQAAAERRERDAARSVSPFAARLRAIKQR
jgi:hypothetical protein